MAMLAQPIVLAGAAALLTGLGASFVFGLWRRGRTEAEAGIEALCAMKWREYAHVIEDLLRERGFARSGDERRPGDGGFDLVMTRGSSRYLVDCKNGAAHRVSNQSIRDMAGMLDLHGAEGAVLATTGQVDASALELARNQRIEVLAGTELWRQVKPWVPHELREDAEARARSSFSRNLLLTVLLGLSAGFVVSAVLPDKDDTETQSAAVAVPSTPSSVPAPAPAAAPVAEVTPPSGMPDTTLSEEELTARRASTALEVRGNPVVGNAQWSTKSTFVVSLHQPGADIPDALFDEICRILVQHEELRFTRLQIESPAVDPEATATVRWRQCR